MIISGKIVAYPTNIHPDVRNTYFYLVTSTLTPESTKPNRGLTTIPRPQGLYLRNCRRTGKNQKRNGPDGVIIQTPLLDTRLGMTLCFNNWTVTGVGSVSV